MSEEQEFFKALPEIPVFSESDYTMDNIPSSELKQSIFISFLTRHYIPLTEEDTKESIESKQWIEATEEEIEEALENLVQDNFLKRTNGKYALDKSNKIVEVVQDARIEYVVNKEY